MKIHAINSPMAEQLHTYLLKAIDVSANVQVVQLLHDRDFIFGLNLV
jgi:hypothetical protein